MRIPSGVTDQYIYFVAVDATDLKTRETGLSSFTVYRSRNGSAATVMTTPTVTEVDGTNMPGVYKLLLDEDMTLDAGDESQEMLFHVTCAGMAPVTRAIELYQPLTQANVRTAVGLASANLDTQLGDIHAKTTNLPSDPADASDIAALIDALPTATENATALLDVADGVETSFTVRQAFRLILAALVGKLSGAATASVTIRDINDTKNRIVATVDADGNRTAVTKDVS